MRELWVALAAFAAVLWAPLLTVSREGPRGLAHYLAGDTLYYVTIASRSMDTAYFTFDGEYPTNGFHPLWQIMLTGIFAFVEPSPEGRIALAFWIGAVLVALGCALFAVALLHLGRRPLVAVLAAVPGVYWLSWARPRLELHSPWAFINGMETPVSIAFFGVLTFFLFARDGLRNASRWHWLGASALLAGMLMARLDDVFLVGLVVVWATMRSSERRLERAFSIALVPTLALGAWLAYSQWTAGTWFPLSGSAKASGLVNGLLRNGYAVLTTFLPIVDIRESGLRLWESEAMRVVQMLVPAACALAFLALAKPFGTIANRFTSAPATDDASGRRAYQAELIGVLALYVLVKVAYNFAFVGLYHQGHWYFPIAFMSLNLFAVFLAAPLLERIPAPRSGWTRLTLVASTALLIAFSAGVHSARKAAAKSMAIALSVWDEREDLQRELDERCPGCGILSFDDATLAFALDNPVTNGLGLAADLELSNALKRGELLDVAWARELKLLATASYPFGVEPGDDGDAVRRALDGYTNLRGQSLDGWSFELLFIHETTGTTFLRFEPRKREAVAR